MQLQNVGEDLYCEDDGQVSHVKLMKLKYCWDPVHDAASATRELV